MSFVFFCVVFFPTAIKVKKKKQTHGKNSIESFPESARAQEIICVCSAFFCLLANCLVACVFLLILVQSVTNGQLSKTSDENIKEKKTKHPN